MTIKELKSLVPGAEIVELNPEFRYLIVVPMGAANRDDLKGLLQHLYEDGIAGVVTMMENPSELRIFETVPETDGHTSADLGKLLENLKSQG